MQPYRLLAGYAWGWSLERFLASMEALQAAGMILTDAATSEVVIERWFKHCPPTNQNHH
jgi:hypothetical protein